MNSIRAFVLGPLEKGFHAMKIQSPPGYRIREEDLRKLPKFVCYKAALLREKLSLQYGLLVLMTFFTVLFISSRIEISHLSTKLREKEYILAPGVQDFIAVAPQSVPPSHVQNAAMEFLQAFGNINATNIDEQYARLQESMSPDLRIQFGLEGTPWRTKVKDENISQILSITEKEIRSNSDGYYQVTAIGKKDSFVNNEHIGTTDIVIEMVLKLIPPSAGKRWYLEIEKLTSSDANSFRVKNTLQARGDSK